MKQNDFDRIERYIAGKTDNSEKKYMESMFLDEVNNSYFRHALENDWEHIISDTKQSDVNLSPLLDRIHHIIRKNESLKQHKPLQKFKRIYMRAAAILVLPLLFAGGLIYSFLVNHAKSAAGQQVISTIYAPLGSRVSFVLPDSTTGMLNSGSKLSYSTSIYW